MEIGISNLALQMQSFLSHLQYNSSLSSHIHHAFVFTSDDNEDKRNNVYLTCAILIWSILYMVFKSYLSAFLRQQKINLIQRDRLVNSLWNWSFHVLGLFYLKFYLSDERLISEKSKTIYLPYLMMKSFCLHFVGVKVFCYAAWMTGFSYLSFTLFAFNDLSDCFNPYILYVCTIKLVDILILEACRFLFILWKNNCGSVFSKFLFVIHCFYWIYMFFYFIPNYLMSQEKEINLMRLPYFYLWYISECIDSVWMKLFKYNRTEPWLKSCLFSSTAESTKLNNIYKKQEKEIHKKDVALNRLKTQIDLWKTVKYAIAVKRTLKRKRKLKKEHKERQEVKEIKETIHDQQEQEKEYP